MQLFFLFVFCFLSKKKIKSHHRYELRLLPQMLQPGAVLREGPQGRRDWAHAAAATLSALSPGVQRLRSLGCGLRLCKHSSSPSLPPLAQSQAFASGCKLSRPCCSLGRPWGAGSKPWEHSLIWWTLSGCGSHLHASCLPLPPLDRSAHLPVIAVGVF